MHGDTPMDSATGVRLLGPVDVVTGGVARTVSGIRRKAVLAAVAIHAGDTVHTDRLIDIVWGQSPPATAANTLQRHISSLRRVLGTDIPVRTRTFGYQLAIPPDSIDAVHADRLIRHTTDNGVDPIPRLRRAFSLARPLPRRHRHPALVPGTGPTAGKPPPRRHQQTHRPATRPWRRHRAGTRIPEPDRPAPAPRAVPPPTDARPLPQRPPGRSPGHVPATTTAPPRRTRHRTQHPAAGTRGRHPAPGTEPSPRARRRFCAGPGAIAVGDRVLPWPRCGVAELDRLRASTDQPLSVAICAVAGTAGIGKTTLAVHWAHRVAAGYPDGQLYVNLRGYDPSEQAKDPADVLCGFLAALGVAV